ncbi:unnamed protein product [Bathycoccus prasinos]
MTSVATSTASSERDAAFRCDHRLSAACGEIIRRQSNNDYGDAQLYRRQPASSRTSIKGMVTMFMKLRYVQPFYVETRVRI